MPSRATPARRPRRCVTHALAAAECSACRRYFAATIGRWGTENLRDYPWRSHEARPFEVLVVEVMLQQTQASNVAKVFPAFVKRFSDWNSLAASAASEIEDVVRPLGLGTRRALVLKRIAESLGGKLFPPDAESLQSLPGVGQYIARAAAVMIHEEHVAPVDVNVARVLERVFGARKLADIRYDPWLQRLALESTPRRDGRHYFLSLIDFGAKVCTARRPKCGDCPVLHCRSRRDTPGNGA